jgi:hypothetical protein
LNSDAIQDFVLHHPWLYCKFVGQAFLNYWEPADHYLFFPLQNIEALDIYDFLYDEAYPVLLGLYLAGMICVFYFIYQRRITGVEKLAWGFTIATIFYNLLAVLVTYGENDRYKYTIEPLLWVLAIYSIEQGARAWQKRATGSPAIPAS